MKASEAVTVSAYAQIANGAALLLICVMAFSVRLFSVVKYESVIHEFDPYFNYRVTTFLTKEGFYNLWNWFDDRTWYPLGRVVGGTVYPVRAHHSCSASISFSSFCAAAAEVVCCVQGLIWTAGLMYKVLHALNIPIHVQEVGSAQPWPAALLVPQAWLDSQKSLFPQVCVFTAPLFSAFCALAAYLFVKEIRGQGAGLTAAAFMAMVPSYISRSVAGSYDNEGVAIFALVFVFFLYVKVRGPSCMHAYLIL